MTCASKCGHVIQNDVDKVLVLQVYRRRHGGGPSGFHDTDRINCDRDSCPILSSQPFKHRNFRFQGASISSSASSQVSQRCHPRALSASCSYLLNSSSQEFPSTMSPSATSAPSPFLAPTVSIEAPTFLSSAPLPPLLLRDRHERRRYEQER